MFSIIIIGGESTENYGKFEKKCAQLLRNKAASGERIRILTIGDEYVEKFAAKFGIETKLFPTEWKQHGKSASFVRNKKIVSEADAILYFDYNKKDLDTLYDYATKCHLRSARITEQDLATL